MEFTAADILVPLYAPASERRPWDSKVPPPVNNTYIGQMKLFATELAFLTLGCPIKLESSVIVYAGAAGGHHIPALASLFPETDFWLYDPAPFAIEPTEQIHIIRGLFTDEIAREWGRYADGPVIFISDVRTSGDTMEEHESEVASNMEMQAAWLETIRAVASSTKFRIPFPIIEADLPFRYFGGRLLYQPYPKPFSMELRLVTNAAQAVEGRHAVSYDSRALEETVFCHNTVVRPDRRRYLNVFTGDSTPYGDPNFDNGYDCTYLLHCIKRYIEGPGLAYMNDPPSMSTLAGQRFALSLTKKLVDSISQGHWTLESRKIPRRPPIHPARRRAPPR